MKTLRYEIIIREVGYDVSYYLWCKMGLAIARGYLGQITQGGTSRSGLGLGLLRGLRLGSGFGV